jgi:hypothetical protein
MRGLLLLLLLAACARAPEGVRPAAAGDSKVDGIVTMAASGTLWNPVGPDWAPAEAAAERKCRGWGYAGAGSYAGWQETCRVYDFHGRCVQNRVTRFYPCSGSR